MIFNFIFAFSWGFWSSPQKTHCSGYFLLFTNFIIVDTSKNPTANAGDIGNMGSIPGLGRSPGEGNTNPPQYFLINFLIEG